MNQYLQACDVIDWQHPDILSLAKQLATACHNDEEITQRCFEFVRDKIQHSGDSMRDEPSCSASEVLNNGTGWCYAKSHLLAALLRANNIPAGLCYQRLTIEGDTAPYSLHGLNAVYLQTHGWYRIDARGNKENVDAQFCPPFEKLAFPVQHPGEADITGIYAEPLPVVVKTLREHKTCQSVRSHLPDIELW